MSVPNGHISYGTRWQGIAGSRARGRSGCCIASGIRGGRIAWLYRTGFWLAAGAFNGQGISENPWTGQSLTAYSLCTVAPNTNAWKRFLNCEIKMTCVPDPATGSSASPPSNPGTGSSVHDYQASINQYQPVRTITVNTATTGSGLDARTSAPFSVYTISDTLTVNINTDTEVKVTETILLGWDNGGTHVPGTIYTITLEGHWFNGVTPSDTKTAAFALYNSVTFDLNHQELTKDGTGAVVPSTPFSDNPWTQPDWPSVLPSSFTGASGLSAPPPPSSFPIPGAWYGYYRNPAVYNVQEAHLFYGCDFTPVGTHVRFYPAGTFSWTLNKFNVALDGTVTSAGTVTHPAYSMNDRFIGEPDGNPTFYVPVGDICGAPDDTYGAGWTGVGGY